MALHHSISFTLAGAHGTVTLPSPERLHLLMRNILPALHLWYAEGGGKPLGPAGEGAWPDGEAWAGGAACRVCFAVGGGIGCPSRRSAASSGAGSACVGSTAKPSSTACPLEDSASASASWKTSSKPQACDHSLFLQDLEPKALRELSATWH